MSIGQKVAYNTALQFIGKCFTLAAALVSLGLLTRYLGTEQFGWYTTVITFLQFFGIIADFGLVIVAAQMLTEKKDETRVFNALISFRLVTACAIICLAPIFVFVFPYPYEVKIGVSVTTVAFLSIAVQQIFTGLFQKHLSMHWNVFAEVIGRSILLGGTVLVVVKNFGFLAALGVVAFAQILQISIMTLAAQKFVAITWVYDRLLWREITKRTWPIAISLLFNVIYLRGDVLALTLFRTQTEVGLYGAAYRILDIITQGPIMFMGVVLPLVTTAWMTGDKERFRHYLTRSAHFLLLFGAPLIIGGIILAKPIMELIGGIAFREASGIAQVLFLALIGGFTGALFGHIIVAINKQVASLWVYASVALIAVFGYVIFIPRFGMYGAAWITVISELLAGAGLWFVTWRITRVTTPIFRYGIKIFGALICMAATLYFVAPFSLFISVPAAAIAYFGASVLFGAVTKFELKRFFLRNKV